MEVIEAIMPLINNGLFPIAMCIIFMLYVKRITDRNIEKDEKYMSMFTDFRISLNNLENTIKQLVERVSK